MNKLSRTSWLLLTIFLAICATTYLFSYILTDPGHQIMMLGGDGGKNYFTYLYHIIYDKGTWFSGMNYPYGENIVYTDAQPILSIPLSYLKSSMHLSVENCLAIMHLCIGLSYVLSIVYTWKTLCYFKVSPPIATLFSLLIGIFSPQLFRITGHFGLSYVCLIPMLFYWTLQYHYNNKRRYAVYMFVAGIIMSFFHLYYAGIVFFWIGFYALAIFIFIKRSFREKLKHVFPLLLVVACIFIITKAFMLLTDPVKDRPTYPWGIQEYVTHTGSLFASTYSSFWQLFKSKAWFGDLDSFNEGYTYLGLVVIVVCLISFVIGINALIRKKKHKLLISEALFSPVWLFIAFGSLLLAFGIPFKWLADYLSLLRQFRSLGRFTWIFYYIITVYSIVVLYHWHVKLRGLHKNIAAYTIVILAFLIWSFEANGYVKFTHKIANGGKSNYTIFFSKNEQSWVDYLKEHGYKKDDFQAMLLLPFFHAGSDKWWIGNERSTWLMTMGAKASLQLHMPIIDAYIARASWSQAAAQLRIVAGPLADKPVLQMLKNDKPFLLFQFDEDVLDADTKYLLEASDSIGHFSQCYVYACYPQRILANDKKYRERLLPTYSNMKAGDSCIVNKGAYYINHFDNGHSKDIFFGSSAEKPVKREADTLLTFAITPATDSQLYEFSVWTLLNNVDYRSPVIDLDLLDSSGAVIEMIQAPAKESVDTKDMWFRTNKFLKLPIRCKRIRCRIENDPAPSYLSLDEMMMRPADAVIISKTASGKAIVNNHIYK